MAGSTDTLIIRRDGKRLQGLLLGKANNHEGQDNTEKDALQSED